MTTTETIPKQSPLNNLVRQRIWTRRNYRPFTPEQERRLSELLPQMDELAHEVEAILKA